MTWGGCFDAHPSFLSLSPLDVRMYRVSLFFLSFRKHEPSSFFLNSFAPPIENERDDAKGVGTRFWECQPHLLNDMSKSLFFSCFLTRLASYMNMPYRYA